MLSTPAELRRAIWRAKKLSIMTAFATAIFWLLMMLAVLKLLARLNGGPFGRSQQWVMLLFGLTYLLGGLCMMILASYLVARRACPRCPACRAFLDEEEIADVGSCPACHARLFDLPAS